ncbi:MAG: hypothetical protein K2J67_03435 [Lachnospiraceae bacterium]|nr:hypothetical protein [Lachnospiraceae bacterium]
MDLFEELKQLGVDIDGGVARLGGNEGLYRKLLGSFVKAINQYYVGTDFDGTEYTDVIEKTHAIKGAAGNLSITPVYEAYTKIVDLLRAGQPEQARSILADIIPEQENIIQCIEKHLG